MPFANSNNPVGIIEDADAFPLYSFMALTCRVFLGCKGNTAVSKRAACWFDFTSGLPENSRGVRAITQRQPQPGCLHPSHRREIRPEGRWRRLA